MVGRRLKARLAWKTKPKTSHSSFTSLEQRHVVALQSTFLLELDDHGLVGEEDVNLRAEQQSQKHRRASDELEYHHSFLKGDSFPICI